MTESLPAAPTDAPVVLTIAGSDSGGGAGIQADLKTIEAVGGFGTAAVTAATAQNTTGVESSHVLPVPEIDAQIEAVRRDFDVRAVKTGMLATAEVVDTVADAAAALDAPVVVDPVMVAETGDRLLTEAAEAAYGDLLAAATLATPNAAEAAVLTDVEVEDAADAREAGRRLLDTGVDAALVTGGHLPGESVRDVLVTPEGTRTFDHPRIEGAGTHGSGCTLSAAVATHLARGESLEVAVDRAGALLERAIRYHHAVGEGPGAVHHLASLRSRAARGEAVSDASALLDRLAGIDPLPPLPDSATLAVSTPYAETAEDVASVAFAPGEDGLDAGRVRFGDAPAVGALLDAREARPEVRIAVGVRAPDPDAADVPVVDASTDLPTDASTPFVLAPEAGTPALLAADVDAAADALASLAPEGN